MHLLKTKKNPNQTPLALRRHTFESKKKKGKKIHPYLILLESIKKLEHLSAVQAAAETKKNTFELFTKHLFFWKPKQNLEFILKKK